MKKACQKLSNKKRINSVIEFFFLAISPTIYPGLFLIAVLGLGLVIPQSAFAYVGPGAGLSVIGTIIALIVAIILAIVGFIWYPFKRILAKLKASRGSTE